MSFDSSLILFPPGQGSPINVGELRRFCDHLRRELAVVEELPRVGLKYVRPGEPTDATWDERGALGTVTDEFFTGKLEWDHERQGAAWPLLWPGESNQAKVIEMAHIYCGSLPPELTEELTIRSQPFSTYPREVRVWLGPVVPMTLADDAEDNLCFGSLSVSFYGPGYFTSQPLAKYWQAVHASPFLARALAVCRSGLPGAALQDVEDIKAHLGELFLNRAEHQPGDWIVSVEES